MGAAFFAFIELRANQVAEFGFDGAIMLYGRIRRLFW
jgi:hypothetical protein